MLLHATKTGEKVMADSKEADHQESIIFNPFKCSPFLLQPFCPAGALLLLFACLGVRCLILSCFSLFSAAGRAVVSSALRLLQGGRH